jgi:Sec-independent protein translocase protein TatA
MSQEQSSNQPLSVEIAETRQLLQKEDKDQQYLDQRTVQQQSGGSMALSFSGAAKYNAAIVSFGELYAKVGRYIDPLKKSIADLTLQLEKNQKSEQSQLQLQEKLLKEQKQLLTILQACNSKRRELVHIADMDSTCCC